MEWGGLGNGGNAAPLAELALAQGLTSLLAEPTERSGSDSSRDEPPLRGSQSFPPAAMRRLALFVSPRNSWRAQRKTGQHKEKETGRGGEEVSSQHVFLHSPYPAAAVRTLGSRFSGFGVPSFGLKSLLPFSFSLANSLHPECCLQDKNGIVVRMRSRSRDDVGTWKTVAWQCNKKSCRTCITGRVAPSSGRAAPVQRRWPSSGQKEEAARCKTEIHVSKKSSLNWPVTQAHCGGGASSTHGLPTATLETHTGGIFLKCNGASAD
ncbi:hypothetical protein EYF80_039721 [Liparis tanakae]|uniref:Uncharacterized protein n=1 Tax=Liparis tanakae TaxID=230148 RepID=A0A4Z2GAR1_9TELE|nr:hypothetical protein EYF80_039721 [Liparis tanakae]